MKTKIDLLFFQFLMACVLMLGLVACVEDTREENPQWYTGVEMSKQPIEIIQGHVAVDLGLSVKWATCNVGADSPEDDGDYFAWGETSPKSTYDRSTYKWLEIVSLYTDESLTKYCTNSDYGTVDNKTKLDLTDDAAYVNWGTSWHIPTETEWEELLTECTWNYTTYNGKYGFKVVSKKNGNSIFIPDADYRENDYYYGGFRYWSSSLNTSNPHEAKCFKSYSSWDENELSLIERYCGLPVRPVGNKSVDISDEKTDAEIAANISQYVGVTCTYDKENLLFRYTINSTLSEKYPQKTFKYNIKYGYGNLYNIINLDLSGETNTSNEFELSVLLDDCVDDMRIYKELRAKIDNGEKLTGAEAKQLEELVSKIETTVKSFQAAIFVSFGNEVCNVYDDFVVEADLNESYEMISDAEIAANISQYVEVTCTYDNLNSLFRYTINSTLSEKFPQKSFNYSIKFGYGNLSNTMNLDMSGDTSNDFELSVLLDDCIEDMRIYKELRTKRDSLDNLTDVEEKQLEELLSKIETTVKSFQAAIFVTFGSESCNVYDDFVAEIDLGKNEIINGRVAVNLGLSVKWATCNVGADSPADYGDYFAWGETSPKSTYDWSTYKWSNGSSSMLTKYNTDSDYDTVDNKTQLDLADDAAYANWGSGWRMPTHEEFKELRTECTWTWTTQKGVKGYKVVSKKNGNCIFLPAAGHRDGGDLYNVGSYGDYWSNSLHTYSDYAMSLEFRSNHVTSWDYYSRYNGYSVRPVCE